MSQQGVIAQKHHTDKKRAYVYNYKAERGCVDCGEKDPWVLDLDHRDPATKEMKPFQSQFPYRRSKRWFSLGWDALKSELAKCDVRCANCHRRRTAEAQGWRRWS